MTDLKQLIEKGATAQMASAAYSSFWSDADHKVMVEAALLSILPDLAEMAAGVAESELMLGRDGTDLTGFYGCNHRCRVIAKAIRTRFAQLMGEGK